MGEETSDHADITQPTPADIRRRNAQFEHKNKTGTGNAVKPKREKSNSSTWLVAFFVFLLGGGLLFELLRLFF
ncbi:hypothetical protein E3P99_00917 [Wallemia hederae]|uniref:Stress-associated endoplasmic reticulum protein n=1 Tax=Wallemia hederae TaxID=1540922 RepID=A0A4T0FVH5_9BASI|nr:hypothetical protein E3P99_00917 [Wallemia hederae]